MINRIFKPLQNIIPPILAIHELEVLLPSLPVIFGIKMGKYHIGLAFLLGETYLDVSSTAF